jgi:hypothetical protein
MFQSDSGTLHRRLISISTETLKKGHRLKWYWEKHILWNMH